jgi:hypothetical protein
MNDSNYIQLPNAAFPTGSTGSIGFDIFIPAQLGASTQMIFDSNSTNGRLSAALAGLDGISYYLPTTGGQGSASVTYDWQYGRYYRNLVTWNGTSVVIGIKDQATGTWAFSNSTLGAPVTAGAISEILVGRYIESTGYAYDQVLDDLVVTNEYLPTGDDSFTSPWENRETLISSFGASWTAGAIPSGGCTLNCGNGFKCQLQQDQELNNSYFAGQVSCSGLSGDCVMLAEDTDAVGGQGAAAVLAGVSSQLSADYITFTANDVVLLGTDFLQNDANAGTPHSTFKTQVSAIFTSITAKVGSSGARLYWILYPQQNVDIGGITDYMADVTTVAATFSNFTEINETSVPYVEVGCMHPTQANYNQFGNDIYTVLESSFPTPIPSPTPVGTCLAYTTRQPRVQAPLFS